MSRQPAWTSQSTACGAIPSSTSRSPAATGRSRTATSGAMRTDMSRPLNRFRRPKRKRKPHKPSVHDEDFQDDDAHPEDKVEPDHDRGARSAQALEPGVAHSLDGPRRAADP